MKTFQILDWWWNRKRRRTPRSGTARGVLIVSSGGLGDTVLFSHVAQRFFSLAENGEPVSLLLRADAGKMAFALPPGATVTTVDFNRLRKDMAYRRDITDGLYGAHYRLIVHTDFLRHPDLDEALVAAAHAPETVAMEPRPWRKYDARLNTNRALYSRLFDSGPVVCDKVLRWSRFADWLLGGNSPLPSMRLADARLAPAATFEHPVVVIQPFSAVKRKQSPPALYRRIVENVSPNTKIVLTGAPGDLESNPEFKSLLELPGVSFDDSVFEDLIPVLRGAQLVISVDTALMHLAVAVGAPTVCLASAAYVGEIVPYDSAIAPDNVRFLYHTMECEGCLGDCVLPMENGMYPCVARLDQDQVIAGVSEILRN
ncbi:MAG: lipopolysaccharide heptosyltransferase family protein [Alphaproteobacteria bacterium]|nr:lipopolysaccharide heptosyltransferase family protein [Alphaproteobacteria bacterium]